MFHSVVALGWRAWFPISSASEASARCSGSSRSTCAIPACVSCSVFIPCWSGAIRSARRRFTASSRFSNGAGACTAPSAGRGGLFRGSSISSGHGTAGFAAMPRVQAITEQGKATGVRMASGEHRRPTSSWSNADSAWMYRYLHPAAKCAGAGPIDASTARVTRWDCSCGTSARTRNTRRSHSTRFSSARDTASFWRTYSSARSSLPISASYLHRPTATDASLAPPGCDAFYVLSPVPNLASGTDWTSEGRVLSRAPLADTSRRRCCPAWQSKIVTSRVTTPQEFQDRLSSYRGAAFGLEPTLSQSAWFRPHNRSEEVENLYLVGAGTHPGAGLPGVLSSARILDSGGARCRIVRLIAPLALPPILRRAARSLQQRIAYISRRRPWLLPPSVRGPAIGALCILPPRRRRDRRRRMAVSLPSPRCASARRGSTPGSRRTRPARSCVRRSVVARFDIPRTLPDALLEGFEWDARRALVRNTVGALCVRGTGGGLGGRDDGSAHGRARSREARARL